MSRLIKKILLFSFKPILVIFFVLGILMSINDLIKSNISFGSLDSLKNIIFFGDTHKELLVGDIITGSFISEYPNLGIVSLRFHNSDRINNDSVRFSIKQAGQDNWYYQSDYKTDQFQPHKLFPFGFPPIKESSGKKYYVEIESVNGTPGDAIIQESEKTPNIVLRYQLQKIPLRSVSDMSSYIVGILYQISGTPKLIFEIMNNFYNFIFLYILFKLTPYIKDTKKSKVRVPAILLFISCISFSLSVNVAVNGILVIISSVLWLVAVLMDKFLADISIIIAVLCFVLVSFQNTTAPYFSENAAIWGIVSLTVALIQKIIFHPRKKSIKTFSIINNFNGPLVFKAIKSIIVWPFISKNFWLGFMAYFRHYDHGDKVRYQLYNGLSLLSNGDCTDFQILRELFIHNAYFKSFPIDFKKPVIFDIGAHKGYFSLFASKKYPKAKIYSFEPSPENFKYLKENLAVNRNKSVVASQLAVATKNTTADFFIAKKSSVCHSMLKSYIPSGVQESIKVKCKTINSIINKNKIKKIDIFKMDIEGLEYEIIFNLPEKVFSKVSVFMIEAHNTKKYQLKHLRKFFEDKGYTTYQPYPQEDVLVAYL